jgi:hypothetical protein
MKICPTNKDGVLFKKKRLPSEALELYAPLFLPLLEGVRLDVA